MGPLGQIWYPAAPRSQKYGIRCAPAGYLVAVSVTLCFGSAWGSVTFQERRNFQVGSPPQTAYLKIFFRFFFSFLLRIFIFLLKKKKRRRRRREKKKMPRRRRRRGFFFSDFFFRFFFSKNNLTKFWKFWEFLRFFCLLWFPLEKCLLVQSAFSAALVG